MVLVILRCYNVCVHSLPVFFLFCLSRVLTFAFGFTVCGIWCGSMINGTFLKAHTQFQLGTTLYSMSSNFFPRDSSCSAPSVSKPCLHLMYSSSVPVPHSGLRSNDPCGDKLNLCVTTSWASSFTFTFMCLLFPLRVSTGASDSASVIACIPLSFFHYLSQTIRSAKGFSLLLFSASSIPVKRFLFERLCSSTKLLRDLLYTNRIGGREEEKKR